MDDIIVQIPDTNDFIQQKLNKKCGSKKYQ